MEIIKEHRGYLKLQKHQTTSDMEVDSDGADKEIRMKAAALLVKKRMTERKRKSDTAGVNVDDEDDSSATKKGAHAAPKVPPPKNVFGNTSDKDTDNSASARGGNDLDEGVDEAGWKMVGDDNSEATDVVSNVSRTRIGLMLTPPPSTKESDKKLCLQAQKWFEKMQEIDNKFMLVPWKAADQKKPLIKSMEKIPSMMSQFRVYFSRAQAKSAGGAVYVDVNVQHSLPIGDIKGDAEWMLKENKMGIFNKTLQVEATTQMGWLLYSTNSLDHNLLAKVLSDEIGVQIALRFKYINTDKYEPDRDERKKWMATHIEVSSEDRKKAARHLGRIYGSTSTKFPQGIRMRLISEFREVKGNPTMMGKHMRLRLRQASFMALCKGHPNDDIMLLDYAVGGKTLRGMIMSIQSTNDLTPGNLFHAIGQDWKGRYTFNFLKSKETEASMIADGIIPYLVEIHGDQVLQFFDPDAVKEKEEWTWDVATKSIINPLSRELDGLEAMDNDYDFSMVVDLGATSVEEIQDKEEPTKDGKMTAQELALSKMNLVLTGQDEDSVSTLGYPMSPGNLSRRARSSLMAASAGTSVRSSATMDTRMTAVEDQISAMEVNLKKGFEDSLTSFFEKFQVAQAQPQPPGGGLAGGDNG